MLLWLYFLSSIAGLFFSFLLATGEASLGGIINYLNLLSFYLFVIPGFVLLCFQKVISSDLRDPVVIAAISGCVYFLIWMLFGILLGQNPVDAVGSTGRALLPFLAILLIYLIPKSYVRKLLLVRQISILQLIFIALAACGKLYLLAQGSIYGGGLNQFSIGAFGFTFLFLYLLLGKYSVYKPIMLLCFGAALALSILSLKRGVWVSLMFAAIYVFYILYKVQKIKALSGFLVLSLLILMSLKFTSLGPLVFDRAGSTFAGSGLSLDSSTSTRLGEISSVLNKHSNNVFTYVFGFGPGALYEDVTGAGLSNKTNREGVYHVHSGFFLTLFRYGGVGLLIHVLPVLLLIPKLFKAIKNLKRCTAVEFFDHRLLGVAFFASAVISWPLSFTGNSFFGNAQYGFSIICCYVFLRNYSKTNRIESSGQVIAAGPIKVSPRKLAV